jgi:hypothetical protein
MAADGLGVEASEEEADSIAVERGCRIDMWSGGHASIYRSFSGFDQVGDLACPKLKLVQDEARRNTERGRRSLDALD